MITADDLIGLIRAYNPSTNAEQIAKAYRFCQDMHEGQIRQIWRALLHPPGSSCPHVCCRSAS